MLYYLNLSTINKNTSDFLITQVQGCEGVSFFSSFWCQMSIFIRTENQLLVDAQ